MPPAPGEPSPPQRRRGLASERARRFRADDAEGVEARHLGPLAIKVLLALGLAAVGLGPYQTLPDDAPRHSVDVWAHEAVAALGRGDPAALTRVVSQGLPALPPLLQLLRERDDPTARREAAEALDLVTTAHGGTLLRADAELLERLAASDPDAEVRGRCAAARARVSIFWR